MTAFTVHVAVSNFFFARVTYSNNLDLEVQALTRQRVVAINGYVVAVQITDGHDLHLAVRRGSVELHANFQLVNAFEHAAAQGADQFSGVFAVSVFWLNGNVQLIRRFCLQGLFPDPE